VLQYVAYCSILLLGPRHVAVAVYFKCVASVLQVCCKCVASVAVSFRCVVCCSMCLLGPQHVAIAVYCKCGTSELPSGLLCGAGMLQYMLPCVAVSCRVLPCAAVWYKCAALICSVLQCAASVRQCVAMCCSILQCFTVCCSVLQMCCSVLQVCYSVLQGLAFSLTHTYATPTYTHTHMPRSLTSVPHAYLHFNTLTHPISLSPPSLSLTHTHAT